MPRPKALDMFLRQLGLAGRIDLYKPILEDEADFYPSHSHWSHPNLDSSDSLIRTISTGNKFRLLLMGKQTLPQSRAMQKTLTKCIVDYILTSEYLTTPIVETISLLKES